MVCKCWLKLTLGVLEWKCLILPFFLNYEKESLKLKPSLKLSSPWYVATSVSDSLWWTVCCHLTRMSGCHTRWAFLISHLMFKILKTKKPQKTQLVFDHSKYLGLDFFLSPVLLKGNSACIWTAVLEDSSEFYLGPAHLWLSWFWFLSEIINGLIFISYFGT